MSLVFISHANPEDNQFSRWLALRLAAQGYQVWSDVTRLLGGEDFWRDIEKAIREHTVKFLFVLSRSSNTKDGALAELHLAKSVGKSKGIEDFIVPLLLDDLLYSDIQIEINRLNAIAFNRSWAEGLSVLLKKLERDQIPKHTEYSPSTVAEWWRTQFMSSRSVIHEPSLLTSNLFSAELPEHIYFHTLRPKKLGAVEVRTKLPYPVVENGIDLISFAKAEDLYASLKDDFDIAATFTTSLAEMSSAFASSNPDYRRRRAHTVLMILLREGWLNAIEKTGLKLFPLASRSQAGFLPKSLDQRSLYVPLVDSEGNVSKKALAGFKTVGEKKRIWHFAVSAKPELRNSQAFLCISSHVVFSDNGSTIWDDPRKMHRARRSQCKNWFNDDWRDRLFAMLQFVAQNEKLILPTAAVADGCVTVDLKSIIFQSAVSYLEPRSDQPDEDSNEGQDSEVDEETGEDEL